MENLVEDTYLYILELYLMFEIKVNVENVNATTTLRYLLSAM